MPEGGFSIPILGSRQDCDIRLSKRRGKNLGIDASVIEANASLRALVNRNTEEQYWDYVKRLAAEQGIDPEDTRKQTAAGSLRCPVALQGHNTGDHRAAL
jgi:hypothetical protein